MQLAKLGITVGVVWNFCVESTKMTNLIAFAGDPNITTSIIFY